MQNTQLRCLYLFWRKSRLNRYFVLHLSGWFSFSQTFFFTEFHLTWVRFILLSFLEKHKTFSLIYLEKGVWILNIKAKKIKTRYFWECFFVILCIVCNCSDTNWELRAKETMGPQKEVNSIHVCPCHMCIVFYFYLNYCLFELIMYAWLRGRQSNLILLFFPPLFFFIVKYP